MDWIPPKAFLKTEKKKKKHSSKQTNIAKWNNYLSSLLNQLYQLIYPKDVNFHHFQNFSPQKNTPPLPPKKKVPLSGWALNMTKVNIAVLRPGTLSQPATAAFAKKRRLQMPRILVKSRGVFQGKSRNTTQV